MGAALMQPASSSPPSLISEMAMGHGAHLLALDGRGPRPWPPLQAIVTRSPCGSAPGQPMLQGISASALLLLLAESVWEQLSPACYLRWPMAARQWMARRPPALCSCGESGSLGPGRLHHGGNALSIAS